MYLASILQLLALTNCHMSICRYLMIFFDKKREKKREKKRGVLIKNPPTPSKKKNVRTLHVQILVFLLGVLLKNKKNSITTKFLPVWGFGLDAFSPILYYIEGQDHAIPPSRHPAIPPSPLPSGFLTPDTTFFYPLGWPLPVVRVPLTRLPSCCCPFIRSPCPLALSPRPALPCPGARGKKREGGDGRFYVSQPALLFLFFFKIFRNAYLVLTD